MAMNGAFHPRFNLGKLYFKRYKSERRMLSMEEGLSEYIKVNGNLMLKQVRRENIFSDDKMKEEYNKRIHNGKVEGFTRKILHHKFRKKHLVSSR